MFLLESGGSDTSMATAPVAGYNVGVALGALPAALVMRAIGRRYGLMSGAMVTSLGGAIATVALFAGSFWGFTLGLLVVGMAGAFSQQYRFAATDHASADYKPRAIAWVLAGGLFAAVLGPQIIILTRESFAPVSYAGSALAIIALGIAGAGVLSLMRTRNGTSDDALATQPARPLGEIVGQPQYVTALACSVGSYALMSFVMTGAPLAMVHSGHGEDMAFLGIQWHVMAMFGPSFFTGRLIVRFGRDTIIAIGLALLAMCAVVALLGLSIAHFWGALVLLGIGWNFAFIGATAMVTETYRPSETNKAQGFHDLVLFSSVATASLLSGVTLNTAGWAMLNWIVFPVVVACGLTLLANRRFQTRR